MAHPVYFIQPHVLDRLLTGRFVADRKKTAGDRTTDRRQVSPLNVTRRAIAYDPRVFANRRDAIIQCVQALNTPRFKLVLVSGSSGRGKTAFLRGVAEMMGGQASEADIPAQLLWFDVSRHTDADEIVRFLVETMTTLCRAVLGDDAIPDALPTLPEAPNKAKNPIQDLEVLLRKAADFPLLLVLDNVEHLVTPDQTLRAHELKEAFNFLLGFPNIKLLLAGRQLPLSDMNPASGAVFHLPLTPVTPAATQALATVGLDAHVITSPETEAHWAFILEQLAGEPYRIGLFTALLGLEPDPVKWATRFAARPGDPDAVLMDIAMGRLPLSARQTLGVLSLIRHGAPMPCLDVMLHSCNPALSASVLKAMLPALLRNFLRKVYPPQLVLSKLRQRKHTDGETPESIDAYFQLAEPFQPLLSELAPAGERADWHGQLQRFYESEKDKHVLQRVCSIRTRHLAAEASYHAGRAKALRRAEPAPIAPAEPTVAPIEAQIVTTPTENITTDAIPWPTFGPDPALRELAMPAMSPFEAYEAPVANAAPMAAFQLTPYDLNHLARLIRQPATATMRFPEETVRPIAVPVPMPTEPSETAPVSVQEAGSGISVGLAITAVDTQEAAIIGSLQVAMDQHDRLGIARALIALGRYRLAEIGDQSSEACFTQALSFLDPETEFLPAAACHLGLGTLHRQHYRHNQALRHLRLAERLLEMHAVDIGAARLLAETAVQLGEIAVYRQEWPVATEEFRRALELVENDPAFHAETGFQLAMAHDEAGHIPEAEAAYEQTVRAARAAGDDRACAAALYNLAGLRADTGRWDATRETAAACLVYDQRTGSVPDQVRTLLLLSRAEAACRRLEDAEKTALQAVKLTEDPAVSRTTGATLRLWLGELAEAAGELARAIAYYRDAQAVAGPELAPASLQRIRAKLDALQAVQETPAHDLPLPHARHA